jgi:hypothetical protein
MERATDITAEAIRAGFRDMSWTKALDLHPDLKAYVPSMTTTTSPAAGPPAATEASPTMPTTPSPTPSPASGCGSSCGCATGTNTETDPASALANTAVDGDSTVPVACTLGAGEMSTRRDEWQALLAHDPNAQRGVTARRPLGDGGLRLEFAPNSDVAEIARLAAAEQGFCRFFGFALVIDGRGLALEVHAPPDGQPVLADLFGTPD